MYANGLVKKSLEYRHTHNTIYALACMHLCLDAVFAAEHVINTLEVVDTLGNGLRVAGWGVALLQVCLLAQLAHLKYSQFLFSLRFTGDIKLTSS